MRALRLILMALFVVGGLVYLNTLIPAPQKTNAYNQVFNGGKDSCGDVKVEYVSDPACTAGSYAPQVKLTSANGGTYTVNPLFENFFCTGSSELGDGTNSQSCIKRTKANTQQVTVGPNSPQVITAPNQSPADYGFTNACGIYQTDFSFTIAGTSCKFGTSALNANSSNQVLAYSGCNTSTACTTTTPKHNVCQNNACVQVDGAGNDSCRLDSSDCTPPHLTVIKIVNNNHGGTKSSTDFSIHVKNGDGDVSDSPAAGSTTGKTYALNAGDYTVAEDAVDGYHQVSISGSCDANGKVTLINGDNKICTIENEDNGSNACTMPTCNTTISGCSYPFPDTKVCSCGPLVCITNTPTQNVTVNNNPVINIQQQQQVLGASVGPASKATHLPSTGTGAEVLLSLFGLLPIGFKLRKLA